MSATTESTTPMGEVAAPQAVRPGAPTDLTAAVSGENWTAEPVFDAGNRIVGFTRRLSSGQLLFYPSEQSLGQSLGAVAVKQIQYDPSMPDTRYKLEVQLSSYVFDALEVLVRDTEQTTDGVISKAIVFYGLALDATRDGKKVAIVDQDWEIDHEITGF